MVQYASQVQVQANLAGDKISATIEAVAPGIDLAVLKLDDEMFFDTHPPLSRATTLPEIKDAATGHGTALAYFPERKGLVRVYGGAVHFFDEEKNTWTLLKDRFPMGPYHNIAKYNAVDKSVIFGGGNGSKVLHRMDAQGNVTQLKEAPFIIRISSTVTAIDPVGGDLLVVSSEDKGKFHALDVKKNEWRQLPDAPISEGASASIEAHGVTLYFANRPTKVFLYKYK